MTLQETKMKVKDMDGTLTYCPSILFYGDLGTGKTAFCATGGDKVTILDCDRGIKTAKHFQDKWTPQRLECDFHDFYEDDYENPKKYMKLRTHLINLKNQSKKDPQNAPKICILDTFTGMVVGIKRHILFITGHTKKNPNLHEWGLIINEVEVIMALFKSLPMVKILTAHESIIESDEGTKFKFLCPGKNLPTSVAGFFDDVFYCRLRKKAGGKTEYQLTSKATAAVAARTRTNFTDDFNMDDGLLKLLENLKYPLVKTETKT